MLPSHNCIIIINVQFSRYMVSFFFKRLNEASIFIGTSVNLLLITLEEKPSNGLAFLRKSHGGCNSPLDCC